jgi:hypothetical protein
MSEAAPPRYWIHVDAATYRPWISQAGLEITSQQRVPEGDGLQIELPVVRPDWDARCMARTQAVYYRDRYRADDT